MAFVNDFLKSLAMPIGDLAKWLEEEHRVPVSDTIEKWNELTGMQVVVNDTTTCEEVEEQTVNIGKKTVPKNNTLVSTTCQHVFIAGNRKGQQCTTKPKGGNDRCSAHKIKVKKGQSNSDDEPAAQATTLKKRPVKKIKSKEIVKTDSESESETKKNPKSMFDTDSEEETETVVVPPATKPKKKIPDSESESEDKPAPKKKPQKKIPPKGTDSEDSDSD